MINVECGKGEGRRSKLREVAERAGVSVMTVSLALREDGAGRMSAETRARVLNAVKELGYQPNARARAFRLGRTNVIGLYAGYGYINVRSPFFTEIVSGLQEGCETVRKDLLLHGVFHGASPEDVANEIDDGRIDGLIVTMPPEDPLGERLLRARLPVVAVSDAHVGMPSVVVDDATGIRAVVDHLHAKGHRRVELVLSPAKPVSALRRREGFFERCASLGIHASEVTIDAEMRVEEFLRDACGRGVTAIACWSDVSARLLLDHARRMGLRVPEELAITGFDGCPLPFADPSPLTTVVAPWAEAARQAVLLLDALLRGETVPEETVLAVRFAPGATT